MSEKEKKTIKSSVKFGNIPVELMIEELDKECDILVEYINNSEEVPVKKQARRAAFVTLQSFKIVLEKCVEREDEFEMDRITKMYHS